VEQAIVLDSLNFNRYPPLCQVFERGREKGVVESGKKTSHTPGAFRETQKEWREEREKGGGDG